MNTTTSITLALLLGLASGSEATHLCWLDFAVDGDLDALVVGSSGSVRLLENRGEAFEDATVGAGLAELEGVRTAIAGDVDADGRPDLLLGTAAGVRVLLQREGAFVEVREPALIGLGPVDGLSWLDADGDRRADLQVSAGGFHRVFVRSARGFRELDLGLAAAAGSEVTAIRVGTAEAPDTATAAPRAANAMASPANAAILSPRRPSTSSPSAPPRTDALIGPAAPICASGVLDQAGTECLPASTVPTLGMMYPLGNELNVDAVTGRVGIGTTTPGYALEVAGQVRSGVGNTLSGAGSAVGGGASNNASGTHATIAGGEGNLAGGTGAFVGGGVSNLAVGDHATVGGGVDNSAAFRSVVVGGEGNDAVGDHGAVLGGRSNAADQDHAAVGGGAGNSASGTHATVLGGGQDGVSAGANAASGDASTVPGGRGNTAAGATSFAAGQRAKALHDGSFVWADSQAADLATTMADQFLVRAAGGMGVGAAPAPGRAVDVAGTLRASDTLVAGEAGGPSLVVASSDLNPLLNADLLDGLDSTAFSQLGSAIETSELADQAVTTPKLADNAVSGAKINPGAVTDAKVAADAAIAGTKIAPDFGAQDVVTLSRVGAGTATPGLPLQVEGGATATAAGGGVLQVGSAAQSLALDGNTLLSRASGAPAPLHVNDDGGHVWIGLASSDRVGIGTATPTSRLTVAGAIESDAGGFVFPDDSVQGAASTADLAPGLMVFGESETPPAEFTYTGTTLDVDTPQGWDSRADGTGRLGSAAAVLDEEVYVFGGLDATPASTVTKTARRYDPLTDTWSSLADMLQERTLHAVAAADGKLYVIGGQDASFSDTATVQRYDPISNTWSFRAPLSMARSSLSAAAVDGMIYAIGGSGSTLVERYDPGTNTWTTVSPLPTSRDGLEAVALNGRVYAIGGDGSAGSVTWYVPSADAWFSNSFSMPSGREVAFAAAAVRDKIYVVGGWTPVGLQMFVGRADVEVYDPSVSATGLTWKTLEDLPVGLGQLAAAGARDRLFVIGGAPDLSPMASPPFTPSDATEAYEVGERTLYVHVR